MSPRGFVKSNVVNLDDVVKHKSIRIQSKNMQEVSDIIHKIWIQNYTQFASDVWCDLSLLFLFMEMRKQFEQIPACKFDIKK